MSEQHIQKLNLKALNTDISTDVETPPIITAPIQDTPNTPIEVIEKKEKWPEEWKVILEKTVEAVVKPAMMSFASIRKDVEKSPPVEEAEKTTDEISGEQTLTWQPIEDKPTIIKEPIEVEIKRKAVIEKSETTEEKTIIKNDTNIQKNEIEEVKKEPEQTPEETEAILHSAEDTITKKVGKKWGFWIFKRKNNKKAALNKKEEEEKVPEEVDFKNYESHFKKESSNFLSKFQKFKYTPKTRVWLVLGLISISTFTIWALMILVPDKHSPEIYKASIIQILGKEKTITIPPVKEIPIILIQEETIEQQKIRKQEESKEKLRQHLLNKYVR
jgi:hypothetical protein